MKCLSLLLVLLFTTIPSIALAGGPNSNSPEPGFWIFLALGAVPFLLYFAKVHNSNQQSVAVKFED